MEIMIIYLFHKMVCQLWIIYPQLFHFGLKYTNSVQYPYDMVLLTNHWSSLNNPENILVVGLWGSATPSNEGKIYGHIRDSNNGINTHITSTMRVMMEIGIITL